MLTIYTNLRGGNLDHKQIDYAVGERLTTETDPELQIKGGGGGGGHPDPEMWGSPVSKNFPTLRASVKSKNKGGGGPGPPGPSPGSATALYKYTQIC